MNVSLPKKIQRGVGWHNEREGEHYEREGEHFFQVRFEQNTFTHFVLMHISHSFDKIIWVSKDGFLELGWVGLKLIEV